jgi:hypothetical protein
MAKCRDKREAIACLEVAAIIAASEKRGRKDYRLPVLRYRVHVIVVVHPRPATAARQSATGFSKRAPEQPTSDSAPDFGDCVRTSEPRKGVGANSRFSPDPQGPPRRVEVGSRGMIGRSPSP